MILHFCLKCGRWLAATQFYARKSRANYPYCKECANASATWAQLKRRGAAGQRAQYQASDSGMVLCRGCGKIKPKYPHVRGSVCEDCIRAKWKRSNDNRAAAKHQPCSTCSGVGLCMDCGGEGEPYQPPPPPWESPDAWPPRLPPPPCRTCKGTGMCQSCGGSGATRV